MTKDELYRVFYDFFFGKTDIIEFDYPLWADGTAFMLYVQVKKNFQTVNRLKNVIKRSSSTYIRRK